MYYGWLKRGPRLYDASQPLSASIHCHARKGSSEMEVLYRKKGISLDLLAAFFSAFLALFKAKDDSSSACQCLVQKNDRPGNVPADNAFTEMRGALASLRAELIRRAKKAQSKVSEGATCADHIAEGLSALGDFKLYLECGRSGLLKGKVSVDVCRLVKFLAQGKGTQFSESNIVPLQNFLRLGECLLLERSRPQEAKLLDYIARDNDCIQSAINFSEAWLAARTGWEDKASRPQLSKACVAAFDFLAVNMATYLPSEDGSARVTLNLFNKLFEAAASRRSEANVPGMNGHTADEEVSIPDIPTSYLDSDLAEVGNEAPDSW